MEWWILFGLVPVVFCWVILGLIIRPVHWPQVKRKREPARDLSLRQALANERAAHAEEHREWEAQFCALLHIAVPRNGDVYDLAADVKRLDDDLKAVGVLYGGDAITYLLRAGHAQHRDHPACACHGCQKVRIAFRKSL